MKKKTYTWRQIKQVVKDIYKVDSHNDDWDVPVIYEDAFLKALLKRLKKITEYVT